MAKLTVAQKIAESRKALGVTSAERAQIEEVAKLTENEVVKNFILAQTSRYDADIQYLRLKIARQALVFSANLSVEAFDKFAAKLQEVVS